MKDFYFILKCLVLTVFSRQVVQTDVGKSDGPNFNFNFLFISS